MSRTLPHPAPVVWDFTSKPKGVALWLGPGAALIPERGAPYRTTAGATGEVRGYRSGEKIRVTHDATTVRSSLPPPSTGPGQWSAFTKST
ncbi:MULTISPECIES: hypothetical protein [Streptomyces]|uniref:hypothetical protein n=1 Tax=Streptomyces TaxID=1883 RepID=UPI001F5F8E5C|nr:hypothetical protein [Streptomyces kasugaensis]